MMYHYLKSAASFLLVGLMLFLLSCATVPKHPLEDWVAAYSCKTDETLLGRYAPVFLIEDHKKQYNLIGTPRAEIIEGMKEYIYVDPEKATIYAQERMFTTLNSTYTNLVYRIHFEKIPGGLIPFHLGKGKNIGLIVIVTLGSRNEPILLTAVHTCGCYLAFVPTSYLPASGFPEGWKRGRQSVYSENLPGYLDYQGSTPDRLRMVILLGDASHRVRDIWLSDDDSLKKYNPVLAEMQPLESLEQLSLENGGTTSFYETSGPRKGYVKGSQKIRERLLMSWWAFDWRVGEDKILGKNKNNGILFYTSLKPWNREKSDLRDFVTFSKFWGWNL